MRLRTDAQRHAWQSLSPYHRRLLMSHLPDDLERDASLRASISTALENVYGPREWDASVAVVDEGEEAVDRGPKDGPEMTYEEIGDELGISVERVRQIAEGAMRKIRHEHGYLEHFVREASAEGHRSSAPRSTPGDIDAALTRARRAA